MDDVYEQMKRCVFDVCEEKGLLTEKIEIRARALSPQEAIGNPEHGDFPLQKGKEKLMQARFRGAGGQAFTDMYGNYEGTLEAVLGLPMTNNHQRAVFVASLNAVLSYLGRIKGAIHCRDEEPAKCGKTLLSVLKTQYDGARITQVGFQPRMVENLAPQYPLRGLDMDPDNIDATKFGVRIEGPDNTQDAVQWADLLLITGTTLVNNTIGPFLNQKPILFYGTTISGAAHLMGWERFCPCSHQ